MRRTIVIGDVHGCSDELLELLDVLAPGPDDQVVLLGDLMDKGPDGPGCVRIARGRGLRSLMGNHEEKHVRWRKHFSRKAANPSYSIPMKTSPFFQEQNARLSEEDVEWLRSCPPLIDLGGGLVAVHGGLQPGIRLEDQKPDKMMRLRYVDAEGDHVPLDYDNLRVPEGCVHWTDSYDGDQDVVFGHEAFSLSSPLVVRRPSGRTCYGIDTGCVHGGRLTALVREDGGRVWYAQVDARRTYSEPHAPIPA